MMNFEGNKYKLQFVWLFSILNKKNMIINPRCFIALLMISMTICSIMSVVNVNFGDSFAYDRNSGMMRIIPVSSVSQQNNFFNYGSSYYNTFSNPFSYNIDYGYWSGTPYYYQSPKLYTMQNIFKPTPTTATIVNNTTSNSEKKETITNNGKANENIVNENGVKVLDFTKENNNNTNSIIKAN
jgi:hypothetical protein